MILAHIETRYKSWPMPEKASVVWNYKEETYATILSCRPDWMHDVDHKENQTYTTAESAKTY